MSIKKFFNFLIFGKISIGLKDQQIFEEKATDENSIRYDFTMKLNTRDNNDDSSQAKCQVGRDIGYMATMFPFSPPGENNMSHEVEEIGDRVEAQNHRLINVKRKRDVMLFRDKPLFKKHKQFASILTVDPTTELEPPTTNCNRRPKNCFVVMRSAPVDIPKKRYLQL